MPQLLGPNTLRFDGSIILHSWGCFEVWSDVQGHKHAHIRSHTEEGRPPKDPWKKEDRSNPLVWDLSVKLTAKSIPGEPTIFMVTSDTPPLGHEFFQLALCAGPQVMPTVQPGEFAPKEQGFPIGCLKASKSQGENEQPRITMSLR